jgi:hypothetical protein
VWEIEIATGVVLVLFFVAAAVTWDGEIAR